MSQQPEKIGVERPAIASLVALGYKHLAGNRVSVEHRHLAPLIKTVLQRRLRILNPWLRKAPGGTDSVLIELRKLVNDDLPPANKAFWEQVLHRTNIQVKDAEGHPRSVRFIDAASTANNVFHVVDQYVGKNADGDVFRPDLLLFVNGLPLAIIECKASHHRLDEALAQLDGYQATFPTQFVFNQVCVGLNRRQGLYGAILTPPAFYAHYRLQDAELAEVVKVLGPEPSEQDQLLWALFEPSRFLELITHFVLFETRDGKTIKKLPRYQQWRAVRKAISRLKASPPIGGVVWHTQGSGKSLTMALLARMLRADSTGLNNPTILVLTDRKDLDKQIFDTFYAVGIKAIQAVSVDGLVKLLSNDYGSVFTSTVQKFQEKDADADGADVTTVDDDNDLLQSLRHKRVRDGKDFFMVEERNANYGLADKDGVLLPAKWEEVSRQKVDFRVLSAKSNFYVLVDEAHRSQYDFLAAFMRASLPNAKFIAFTATPLLKDDKHTLSEFGGDTYIDEYRLHEAVVDGATLPIKYQDAWVQLAPSEQLDQAFKDQFGQDDEARQQALKKALLARWRQAGDRMEKVAEHLVDHFVSNVQAKGLKAMLVCDGRDMAVRYKDLIDGLMQERKAKGLPTFESRVVISLASATASRTGASTLQAAQAQGVQKQTIETIEERVRAEIKAGKEPVALPTEQISSFVSKLFPLPYGDEAKGKDGQTHSNNVGLIIVSDMLLTGWDAPVVSTMYLDKPLKEHTLLQAIARVNRTMAGKNAGYIVDY
ncbi:type I restriction endonuclease subunit R, partial [Comamonas jiangduensis]|uniref:type I restriction endonuclease subunit R n=1 Tax=Comamonas jiangduensis TaxID=1194168 RepID=UPI003BF7E9A4